MSSVGSVPADAPSSAGNVPVAPPGLMVADAIAMSVQYGGKHHLCSLLKNATQSETQSETRSETRSNLIATRTPMEAVAHVIPILYGKTFQQACFLYFFYFVFIDLQHINIFRFHG